MYSPYSIDKPGKIDLFVDDRAKNDLVLANQWLKRYEDSPNTFESYRKEVARFLLWLSDGGVVLNELSHEHLSAYFQHLKDPSPEWTSDAKRSIHDPDWKPFSKPLSESSIRLAKNIINNMLNWLVAADHIRKNPMVLLKKRAKAKGNVKLERFLTDSQVLFILETIELMPERNAKDVEIKARNRWLFCALYYSMLRISEITNAMTSDIRHETGADGHKKYWIRVTGKGGRVDDVPIPDEMIEEFERYVSATSRKVTANTALPLIMRTSHYGKAEPMTRSGVHLMFKKILAMASTRMIDLGMASEAAQLEKSSAHWIRHTAGSALARKGANIVDIRDSMRHSDISTTSIYMHGDKERLHDVVNTLHKLPVRKD